MVIHLTTELLDKPKLFEEIMGDVATLAILGVRPVVIVGIGDQAEAENGMRLYAQCGHMRFARLCARHRRARFCDSQRDGERSLRHAHARTRTRAEAHALTSTYAQAHARTLMYAQAHAHAQARRRRRRRRRRRTRTRTRTRVLCTVASSFGDFLVGCVSGSPHFVEVTVGRGPPKSVMLPPIAPLM
eukprot:2276268-Pleurochrysis_carterae.AAC.2